MTELMEGLLVGLIRLNLLQGAHLSPACRGTDCITTGEHVQSNQGITDTVSHRSSKLVNVSEPCAGLRTTLLIHGAWDVLIEGKTQHEDICIFGSDHHSLVHRLLHAEAFGCLLPPACTSALPLPPSGPWFFGGFFYFPPKRQYLRMVKW